MYLSRLLQHFLYDIIVLYAPALRGRPVDSEGGGRLALFENKYSDLEKAGNK